ncbi:hypothetical protein C8A01DRAFT_51430 [Parachaetomium inaequale]|uniref:Uncharacterized protein n=1 Tax=Parachaetomium inaequale TaxID=2588326 RepID=A0AAN6P4H3_9PEZI|nr:hypothetical protein C8A01DRAFT_51430 [Parachaetomium inaequale]
MFLASLFGSGGGSGIFGRLGRPVPGSLPILRSSPPCSAWASTPTLLDDESTSELEPAGAEPRLQPQSPSGAASGHDGEKNEEGPTAPPYVRESVAGLPTLPDDRGIDDYKPAGASLPIQPPAGRDQANLRRRHRNTDDEEDYCPSVYSDAEHGEDDIVRPPPNKRCRRSTQQTRLSYSDVSGGTKRSSRHPRRQRGAAYPPSSPGEDIEIDSTPATTFEELPLGDTVLKRHPRNSPLGT